MSNNGINNSNNFNKLFAAKSKMHALATKKILKTLFATLMIFGSIMVLTGGAAAETDTIPAWPSNIPWLNYTIAGEPVTDYEDKPYENDPTHGIANVQPKAVDIASGVDASGGGAENNPGDYTSVQWYYYDQNSDSNGMTGIIDDWLFLRMRVAEDPTHGGKYYFKSYHWDILVDTDGDIWKEFVIDINGGGGEYQFGTVGVYYNDNETYEYEPSTDQIWAAEASKLVNHYTRAVAIDYGPGYKGLTQYWIEYRIPVTKFQDKNDTQQLGEGTGFRLFFSTSASMTNPLQKDWMAKYVFATPPNITVEKSVAEKYVDPGDIIHYTIYFNNTGESNAGVSWINDTLPNNTKYLNSNIPYSSLSGNIYSWKFDTIPPGNHTLFLNVTVDKYLVSGTELVNYVHLDYTDESGAPYPSSEDSVKTIVTAPEFTLEKSVAEIEAYPGDSLHYKIYVTNTAAGCAKEVWVTDVLPTGTTFKEASPYYTSISGNTVNWYFTSFCPGTQIIYLNVTAAKNLADGLILNNSVELQFNDANGNLYPKQSAWAETKIIKPHMSIEKTAGQSTANPGDIIEYTIKFVNDGLGSAGHVWINDTIPQYTTFISASPSYTVLAGKTYSWYFTNVAPGTYNITLKLKVDIGTPDETVLVNTMIMKYWAGYDDIPYPDEVDTEEVTVTAPIMTISKIADVSTADPDDIITYTIKYENKGTGVAGDVWINDTIPAHTTFVSSVPEYTSVSGNTYTWHFTDVKTGSNSIIVKVKVDIAVDDGTELVNKVTMDYFDENGNPYTKESDSVKVIVTAPIFTLDKEADVTTADPSDIITYTITYKNLGTGNAENVWINDTLPVDTTMVSALPTYDYAIGNTYTWYFSNVAPGSYVITVNVKVNSFTNDQESMVNKVTLEYSDANGNQPYSMLLDYAYVTCTTPIMSIAKVSDVNTADPGDTITYTITYNNTGTGIAAHVWVNDTISANSTYVSSTPTYTSVSGDTYTWYFKDVEPGTYKITFKVRVDIGTADGTKLVNEVKLDYTDTNSNQFPQKGDSTTVTATSPIMTISKVADVATADPSDIITYNLTYKNTGTGVAGHVWINDTISADTTYVSSSPTYTSVSGNTYTWHFTDVPTGTYWIILKVQVKMGTEDGTKLVNEVTLDYTDANGGQPYSQQSDNAIVIVNAPIMTVSKESQVNTSDPGDIVTYTITYKNLGTGTAGKVVIIDTIPADTTYVSSSPSYTSVSGDIYTWQFTNVTPGTYYITINLRIDVGTADKTVLVNKVTMDYSDLNYNPYKQEIDYANVTVTAPIMSISKVADVSTADPSDVITYTIEYKNTGTGTAGKVWIKDTIPGDTTYMLSTPAYTSVAGDMYTWYYTNVRPGNYKILLKVSVDIGTADKTVLTNKVTLDYTDANSNPYTQKGDSATVTVTSPFMTISKVADVSTADPSDVITYTIEYKNMGTGIAGFVWVNDTIPADTTYISSTPTYTSVLGDTYTWYFKDVVNGTYRITLNVTVDIGTADKTVLLNKVSLDYTDQNGNQPYSTQWDFASVTVTSPIMTITKVADVSNADPDDIITYTIEYKNLGTGVAEHVWVNDTIPADTTYVSSTPIYTSDFSDAYTWYFKDLATGTYKITLKVKVDIGTADGTRLINKVTLDYTDANGNPYKQEGDSATVTVNSPIMTITKVADVSTADPDDIITYTIEYKNTGTGTAAHVWVNDTIPTDTTYVSSTPTYTSVSGDTFTWHFKDVATGIYKIILRVKVDIDTADGTKLVNKVTLDYTDANGNPYTQESDMATVTVTAPILTITKIADVSTADPSDIITYTIEYKNTGTGTAAHVWVNDTIAADTTFVSAAPLYTSISGDTYTWHFKDLATGTYKITLKVTVDIGTPDKTELWNYVTLEYTDANSNQPYAKQSDSAKVVVTAPIMTVSKIADVTTADPSDIITYTIEYKNLGTGVSAHVWVNDTIPVDTTYVTSTPNYTSVSGDTYTWYFKDLKPGTYKITLKVKVDVATPDGTKLVNKVTLDYTDTNGNPYTQESDMATVIATAPIMTITKVADVATADPSDIITYTIEYKNTGTGVAGHVWINDTIPADTKYVSSNPTYTSVSGDVYTWYFNDVKTGTYTITLKVRVKVGTADKLLLTNKVTLDYTDQNGNQPYAQQSDTAFVTVTAPIMDIGKVADVSTADPDDIITYTIKYENIGTGIAGHVWINDTIAVDTTYVSSSTIYTSVSGDTFSWHFTSVKTGVYYITLKVKVDVSTSDKTILINYVTLDYTDTNVNGYPQKNDSAKVLVTSPVLNIEKDPDVTTADPGDVITYTIEYINNGSGNSAIIYINDTIPSSTVYVSSSPAYKSVSGNTYTWIFYNVSNGNYQITLKLRVLTGTADKTKMVNYVTMDYSDANTNFYPQENDTAVVTVTAPIMSISKIADVSTADPGDIITYTITYKNTGTGAAGYVWVNDTISSQTVYVSSTPAYTSVSGNTYTWLFSDVKTGSYTITLKVRVKTGTTDTAVMTNKVSLDYTDATGGQPYATQYDSTDVTTTAPIISISKAANVSTADPGDIITYTITYKNTGTGVAGYVWVNDTISSQTVYVSSTPAYTSVSGNTYTWLFKDVKTGSYTITLRVRVKTGTTDTAVMTNKVSLDYTDATGGQPYPTQYDSADVTATAPIMSISKIADVSTADPGDIITYTITYKNTGTGAAGYVWINDTIPSKTVYVSSTPAYTSVSGNTYTWLFKDVKTGTYSITLKVRVMIGTADKIVMTNRVSLDYTDATGGQPYTTQYDSTDVTATAPILSISKIADVSTADPGDIITYTITYKNMGTGAAGFVWINDTIPSQTVYYSSTPAYTSVSGNVYTWLFKDVKTGTYTVILKVRVKTGTVDRAIMTNKVSLDYTDATGGQPYKTQYDSTDVIATAPILSISKIADVSTADPGDIITYTITYKNTGTGAAGFVWINDTIPTQTVYYFSAPMYTSVSGNTHTWLFKDVKTGTSTVTLKVRVSTGTADKALMTNKVSLDYTDATGGQPYKTQYDSADVSATAPIMSISKVADVSTADPGDIITYTITYKNTGTGAAGYVWINDTIPTQTVYHSSTPAYTLVSGNTFTWLFKDVKTGTYTITLMVRVKTGTADKAVMTNNVSLDYADANGGQPYATQYDSTDVTATAPVLTIDKTADQVMVNTYIITDFKIRIAGEKWHDVRLTVYDGNKSVALASVTRFPGDPDDQSVTIFDVKINPLSGTYYAVIEYTPMDDPINGKIWGANPCWLTLMFEDSSSVRLKHTFNVRHNNTWIWTIDNFEQLLAKAPISYEVVAPYNITYKNTGTGVAGHVWVNDTIPNGSTFVSSTPNFTSVSGDTYTWHFTDVEPGTYYIKITVFKVVGYITEPSVIVLRNNVTLDYTDANGGQPYATQSDYAMVNVTVPILTLIKKEVNPNEGKYGDHLTVTITLNSRIENGTVMDCLPVEFNYTGNALDDDSDGLIDEEAKDGIDNDGDGRVDEDLGNFMVDGKPIKSGLNYTGNKLIYSPVPLGQHKIKFDIVIIEKTLIKHKTTNVVQLIHNGKVQEKDTADITLLVWNNAPTAIISSPSDCDTLYEDIQIKFVGDHSYDDGSNLSYSWDFGDGNTSTDVNPTHTYPEPGEYTVSLKITDIYSNSSENKITITILRSTPCATIVKPIKLEFSIGENITFKGKAVYIGNQSTLVYNWNFGDNCSAYGKEAVHNFSAAGEYLITLKATDFDGDYDTAMITLTICNTTDDDDDDEEPDDDDEEPDDDDDEQDDDVDEEPDDDDKEPDNDDDEGPDDDDEVPDDDDDEEPDDDDDEQDDDDDNTQTQSSGITFTTGLSESINPLVPDNIIESSGNNKNQESDVETNIPEVSPLIDYTLPYTSENIQSISPLLLDNAAINSSFVAKNYMMPLVTPPKNRKDEENPDSSEDSNSDDGSDDGDNEDVSEDNNDLENI